MDVIAEKFTTMDFIAIAIKPEGLLGYENDSGAVAVAEREHSLIDAHGVVAVADLDGADPVAVGRVDGVAPEREDSVAKRDRLPVADGVAGTMMTNGEP